MKKRELRRFRKATGRVMERAVTMGELTRKDQATILIKMMDDDQVELMAAVAKDQAVKTGMLSARRAAKGDIKWVGLGKDIDWMACLDKIIALFVTFL